MCPPSSFLPSLKFDESIHSPVTVYQKVEFFLTYIHPDIQRAHFLVLSLHSFSGDKNALIGGMIQGTIFISFNGHTTMTDHHVITAMLNKQSQNLFSFFFKFKNFKESRKCHTGPFLVTLLEI